MNPKEWVQTVLQNRREKKFPHAWWETAAEFPADEDAFGGSFDPLGSYTGTPNNSPESSANREEALTPEQDADDL